MVTRRQKQRSFKSAGKPDLLEVLQRRRKTVADLLAQNDVRTAKQLDALLFSYLADYDLSPKFVGLAEELLASMEADTLVKNDPVVPEEVMMDTLEVVEEKQPRKRAKKSSEKPD